MQTALVTSITGQDGSYSAELVLAKRRLCQSSMDRLRSLGDMTFSCSSSAYYTHRVI